MTCYPDSLLDKDFIPSWIKIFIYFNKREKHFHFDLILRGKFFSKLIPRVSLEIQKVKNYGYFSLKIEEIVKTISLKQQAPIF